MIDDRRADLLSAADDGFHAPGDDPWFFESSWWSFYVPERDLGAWIYHWVRPNQSTQGGGCWIYDGTTPFHLEVPYYACYENMPFDRRRPARHHVRQRRLDAVLEPLRALSAPFRRSRPHRLRLRRSPPPCRRGRRRRPLRPDDARRPASCCCTAKAIAVDSIAMRDRSWSPRPERWKDGHIGYCSAGTRDVAFLANSAAGHAGRDARPGPRGLPPARRPPGRDRRRHRVLERDPEHGYLQRITVDADDADGRHLHAVRRGAQPDGDADPRCPRGLLDDARALEHRRRRRVGRRPGRVAAPRLGRLPPERSERRHAG